MKIQHLELLKLCAFAETQQEKLYIESMAYDLIKKKIDSDILKNLKKIRNTVQQNINHKSISKQIIIEKFVLKFQNHLKNLLEFYKLICNAIILKIITFKELQNLSDKLNNDTCENILKMLLSSLKSHIYILRILPINYFNELETI